MRCKVARYIILGGKAMETIAPEQALAVGGLDVHRRGVDTLVSVE